MDPSSINIPIILEDKKVHRGPNFTNEAYEILQNFAQKINQRRLIRDIEAHFNVVKNSSEKVKLYEIKLHVQLANGKLLIGQVNDKNIITGLRAATHKISRELEKIYGQKKRNLKNKLIIR